MRLSTFILCVFSLFHLANAQSGLNVNQGTPTFEDGYLTIGDESGSHIAIANNDIQQRFGAGYDQLFLNFYGGNVQLGSGEGRLYYERSRQAVGVGTSIPEAKLHVDGTTDASLNSNGLLLNGDSANTENLIMEAMR